MGQLAHGRGWDNRFDLGPTSYGTTASYNLASPLPALGSADPRVSNRNRSARSPTEESPAEVMQNNPQIIWQPQPGPQTDLVTCPVFEVFYGGARGGGKTEASIGDWFSHAGLYGENASGLFIRRKLTQLVDVIKRFRRYGAKLGAHWYEQKKELHMPNGAILKFAYLESSDDAEEYQGHEYTRVYVEEVTNFPFADPINMLKGTLRSAAGVPCGIRLTGNPGGPGHHWVKHRYIDPNPKGYQIIREEEMIPMKDGSEKLSVIERVFIPARLQDNVLLLENDPGYVLRLRQTGSEALVKAWLEGDWNGVDGTFFSEFLEAKHVLTGVLHLPSYITRFRALDWGSAAPFSVGWYAVSDGTFGFARGALIKYQEWYGWNGKPNTGLKMSANLVAQGIINRDADSGVKPSYGVADPSIFATNGGPSIAEMMLVEKCAWFRGDNARQPGWEQLRRRLSAGESWDSTLLLFHESCEHTIRTLPYAQHDEKNAEDIDSDGEDHALDETRYACMSRPITREEPKNQRFQGIRPDARSAPTINELIKRQSQKDRSASARY